MATRTDEAVEFVKVYGAYLNLHLSLVCAAMLRINAIIEALLALAKHDPRHREVKKELSKATSLVLYDPVSSLVVYCTFHLALVFLIIIPCSIYQTMLSAIVSHLNGIREVPKSDRRRDLMNICVLAYPDLRPWQVRQACLGTTEDEADVDLEFHKMYCEYLSLLLHPWDGQDAARQDVGLVTVSTYKRVLDRPICSGSLLTRTDRPY